MRKPVFAFVSILLCMALSACGSATPAASTSAIPLATSPSPDQMLHPPTTTVPVAFTPSVTPSVAPANLSPATLPSLDAAATLAAGPCSPLAEDSLIELPEIVSAPYNPPPMGSDARHQGVDFSFYRRGERTSILGEGVQSVFAGRVAASISGSFPYGNIVIVETPASALPPGLDEQLGIRDDQSLYALYAHMGTAPFVALDDAIAACQALGEVGKSGNAGVPHLHLEMRLGPAGQQFPSMAFYSTQATQAERDNYARWRMSGEFRHFDPMSVLAP